MEWGVLGLSLIFQTSNMVVHPRKKKENNLVIANSVVYEFPPDNHEIRDAHSNIDSTCCFMILIAMISYVPLLM